MAVAIADRTARSEIALYAVPSIDVRGRRVFHTARPREELIGEEILASRRSGRARY